MAFLYKCCWLCSLYSWLFCRYSWLSFPLQSPSRAFSSSWSYFYKLLEILTSLDYFIRYGRRTEINYVSSLHLLYFFYFILIHCWVCCRGVLAAHYVTIYQPVVCPSLVKRLSIPFYLDFNHLYYILFSFSLRDFLPSAFSFYFKPYRFRSYSVFNVILLSSANIFCIDICTFVIRITNSI